MHIEELEDQDQLAEKLFIKNKSCE